MEEMMKEELMDGEARIVSRHLMGWNHQDE